MKSDLDKIKDEYGENFMHLFESELPALIEKGVLYDTISKLFNSSYDLYDDIAEQGLENEFKNYVLSNSEKGFEIPGYTLANDGKFY